MKTFLCAGVLGLLMTAAAAPMALADDPAGGAGGMFHATTLNLGAYGEVQAEPDMASINLGVTVEAKTAAGAMAANGARMNAVVAALKAAGIAGKDIQTSGLNLNPQYVYEQNQPPRLTGYQAANQVTVVVHNLARLGAAVDATVSAGANQVNGVSFGIDDPTVAENAARQAAVRALQAKAELYARATGYKLSRLVSLSEGGGYAPAPPIPVMRFAKAMAADTSTQVSPGELKVRIEVTGLYELGR